VASFNFGDLTDGKYSRGFNLSTNQWAASGGSVEFTNYTVTPNIDGWFLVSAIYTPTGATGGKAIAFLLGGTTLGQTVSFDTPQLEAGSFPTSYIPTTTAPLARSADVCSITGGDFTGMFNATEGTLYAEHYQYGANTYGSIFMAVRGDDAGKIQISRSSSTQAYLAIKDNANNENFVYVPSLPVGVVSKSALAYKANDSIGSVNSALSPLDTSVTLGTPIQFLIGHDNVGAGRRHNGAISAIRYYRKRLPAAKLTQLTT
jgi:hypothetical protein